MVIFDKVLLDFWLFKNKVFFIIRTHQESKSVKKYIMTNILTKELNMLFYILLTYICICIYLFFVMLVAIIVQPLHHRDSQSLLYIKLINLLKNVFLCFVIVYRFGNTIFTNHRTII